MSNNEELNEDRDVYTNLFDINIKGYEDLFNVADLNLIFCQIHAKVCEVFGLSVSDYDNIRFSYNVNTDKYEFYSKNVDVPSRARIATIDFEDILKVTQKTKNDTAVDISNVINVGLDNYSHNYNPTKSYLEYRLLHKDVFFDNKLRDHVNRDYELKSSVSDGKVMHYEGYDERQTNLLDLIIDKKAEIKDDSPILGSSVPIPLLQAYSNIDCMECWLCNHVDEYEMVPAFVWSEYYMYILNKDYDVLVLNINNSAYKPVAPHIREVAVSVDENSGPYEDRS